MQLKGASLALTRPLADLVGVVMTVGTTVTPRTPEAQAIGRVRRGDSLRSYRHVTAIKNHTETTVNKGTETVVTRIDGVEQTFMDLVTGTTLPAHLEGASPVVKRNYWLGHVRVGQSHANVHTAEMLDHALTYFVQPTPSTQMPHK